ncbi:hypothetical protein ACWD74_39165, partial [Streptomyces fagopyri]
MTRNTIHSPGKAGTMPRPTPSPLQSVLDRAAEGERITPAEALALYPKMVRLFVLGSERSDGLDRKISPKW